MTAGTVARHAAIGLLLAAIAPLAARAETPVTSGVHTLVAAGAEARSPAELLQDARRARNERQYARCESLAILARDAIVPRTRADSLLLAKVWFEISISLTRRRMYSDTLGLYAGRQSLRIYDRAGAADSSGAADAHETVGEILSMQRRTAEALVHLRRALAILLRTEGETEWVGFDYERLGILYLQHDQPDSAIISMEQALQIYRRIQTPHNRKIGDALIGIGLAYEHAGDDEHAEQSIAEGLRSIEEQMGPDDPALAVALGRAAGFAQRHGEIAHMVDLSERANRIWAAHDDPERWVTMAQLATAYHALGDEARAARLFDQALPALAARMGAANHALLSFATDQAEAHRALGDTPRALAICADIRRRFDEDSTRTDRDIHAQALYTEALIRHQRGEDDVALDDLARARREFHAANDVDPAPGMVALAAEMDIRSARGEARVADSLDAELRRVIPRLRDSDDLSAAWLARGHRAVARQQFDSAFVALHNAVRIDREAVTRDARALSNTQALLLADVRAGSLDELVAVAAGHGAAAQRGAWDEVVRRRGLVRAELARRRPPPASGDPRRIEQHEAWRRAMRRLARFEVVSAGQPRDSAQVAKETALHAEVDEMERRLMRDAVLVADPEAVSLNSVLRALPAGTALVAFAAGRFGALSDELFAFVARAGHAEVTAIDLGSADHLALLVGTWRRELGEPNLRRRSESRCRATGFAVRQAVWDPIARAMDGANHVYLVPEAPLHGLPWGALPEGSSRYLVETAAPITVLDAERDLLARPDAVGRGMLAVGGVDFDRVRDREPIAAPMAENATAALRSGSTPCGAAHERLGALPGTGEEARAVTRAFTTSADRASETVAILAGDSASERAFKSLAPGRRILHLATHGVALDDTCGRSIPRLRGVGGLTPVEITPEGEIRHAARKPTGAKTPDASAATTSLREWGRAAPSPWAARQQLLALAGANLARDPRADENDGLLTAAEVATLDLRGVEWVVLSACHSGAGEAWMREGVLGMQRAFHLAGARTVLASQWAVEDESTAEWMRALYAARGRGAIDAAAAMTSASRSILAARRHSGRATHPFYWAAFTSTME